MGGFPTVDVLQSPSSLPHVMSKTCLRHDGGRDCRDHFTKGRAFTHSCAETGLFSAQFLSISRAFTLGTYVRAPIHAAPDRWPMPEACLRHDDRSDLPEGDCPMRATTNETLTSAVRGGLIAGRDTLDSPEQSPWAIHSRTLHARTLGRLQANVRLFTSDKSWIEGAALEQLKSTARLPGMVLAAGFPDLHPGKGIAVGAAFVSRGVFYPTLAGNDIGCGMSFWATDLPAKKLKLDRLEKRVAGLDEPWDGDLAPWRERYGLKPTLFGCGARHHRRRQSLRRAAGGRRDPRCRGIRRPRPRPRCRRTAHPFGQPRPGPGDLPRSSCRARRQSAC